MMEIIRLGLGNLRLHLLRTVLTSLGIILGVAAVIVMVAIGEGNKQAALREIEKLGATNIIVRSQRPPESGNFGSEERSFVAKFGLTRKDFRVLQEFLPDALHLAPLKRVGDEMSYREKRVASQAYGVTPELIEVANLRLARGRYLTTQDMEERSPVAVIGHNVAEQFFPLEDPLGKEFRIGSRVFRVVGVLQPVGLAGGAGSALVGRDLNKDVHLPRSTAELEFGDTVFQRQSGSFSGEEVEISEIYITAPDTASVIPMSKRVKQIIDQEHAETKDAEIIVPWELLENAKRTTMVMNVMLISIAAISLLVGGIGIMNIMLASVTERTREIGIRRALGATRDHIVMQFLVETGSLSAVGGLIGIVLGVSLAVGIESGLPYLLNETALRNYFETKVSVETQVTSWSVIVSFLVAAAVGLIFGIYPAIVASRKDPIEALRHD